MKVKSEGWEIWHLNCFPSLSENITLLKTFRVGSWVENMNHGLIGEITSWHKLCDRSYRR